MAYYDALIAAWNSTTQPPAGVTGSGLLAGDATAQKCTKINGWTMNGVATPMTIGSTQLYNLIVPSEFDALSPANQQLVRDLFELVQVDCSPNTSARTRLNSIFPAATTTRQNFIAYAKTFDAPTQDWCFVNGYPSHGPGGPGNISVSDAQNAGLV